MQTKSRCGQAQRAGCALALLLTTAMATAPEARSAPRGDVNGRIAFDSVRDGNRDIYAISGPATGDGGPAPDTSPTRLTTDTAADAKPSWSPPPQSTMDRRTTYIVFQRTAPTPGGGTNTDLYRLAVPPSGAPTTAPERITRDSAPDTAPAWAPSHLPGTPGEADPNLPYPPIAFERNLNGKRDIFITEADGGGEQNLTDTPEVDEANPDWSPAFVSWSEPAGPHLAFESDADGTRQVYVMGLRYDATVARYTVTGTTKVTAGQPSSSNPSWYAFSPGESQAVGPLTDVLTFSGPEGDAADGQIHYAEYQRTDPATQQATIPFSQAERISTYTVTSSPSEDSAPVWSPQGDRIAYQSNREGTFDIFVSDPNADDETDTNVTQFAGDDENPDWEAPIYRTNEVFPIRPRGRRSRSRARRSSVPTATTTTPAPSTATTTSPSTSRGPSGRPGPPDGRQPPQRRARCTRTGTERRDVLRGTRRRDVLCGGRGNDVLVGLGGNDTIYGDAGHDRIRAGSGNDTVLGGAGNDGIDGGPGRDTIDGGSGRDRITARDRGRDRISGGSGRDQATIDRRGDQLRGVERVLRGSGR